jgi:hypothetical protein
MLETLFPMNAEGASFFLMLVWENINIIKVYKHLDFFTLFLHSMHAHTYLTFLLFNPKYSFNNSL